MFDATRLAITASTVAAATACTTLLGGDYRAVDSAGGGAGGLQSEGGEASLGGGGGGHGLSGGTGGASAFLCPQTGMGPTMARVDTARSSYCMDVTEVTRDQYRSFVEAGVSPQSVTGEPVECSWNADYTPDVGYPPDMGAGSLPVVGVDWCDALAFCTWAGKRLCGRFGGGHLDPAGAADPSESEWTNVCTNAGTTTYPYGAAFDLSKCNVALTDGVLADVATFPECRGEAAPFALVMDLSANASEWENSCETGAGNDTCLRRGGHYTGDAASVRCDAALLTPRDATNSQTSFRCCAGFRQ